MKPKALSLIALALSALPMAIPAAAHAEEVRPILVQDRCNRASRLWIDLAVGYRLPMRTMTYSLCYAAYNVELTC